MERELLEVSVVTQVRVGEAEVVESEINMGLEGKEGGRQGELSILPTSTH